MLAELQGFTAVAESLPPPAAVRILNGFSTIATQVVHRHGGTVFDAAGDCLLLGFGVPLADAAMEQRALTAACELVNGLRALEIACEEEHGLRIAVGIGLHRGEVLAAHVGSLSHREYTVLGDAVKVAARLKDLAQPGQVLCTDRLYATAAGMAPRLAPGGVLHVGLKGRLQPVLAHAWRVAPPPDRLRPLLIDDVPEFRSLLAGFLRLEWPDAEIASLDPLSQPRPGPGFDWSPYNVVLLDCVLGSEDGLAWLQALRQLPGLPPVVFIVGTDGGSDALAARALQAGAAECLSRNDLSRARLAEAVREALRGKPPAAKPASAPAAAFDVRRSPRGPHEEIAIADYRVIRKLGDGGMAVVYLAEHRPSGEQRVLKILDRRNSRNPEFLRRFMREHGVISGVASPHVVRIHDEGLSSEHAYIAMEFLPGGDLKSRIGGGLAPAAALQVFRQLLLALQAVHAAGIVHRDVKPHNIMFREDGTLVLLDFGIAQALGGDDDGTTPAGTVLGTPLYMSPEQGEGAVLDARTDLYSAGVILWEMLVGSLPYQSSSSAGLVHQHRYAPVPDLPPALAEYQPLLARLLAKDPADRPRGAHELLMDE
jgi:class 3 adenylate cyclase/DNA-binding NarL/FixJ family response regulator